MNNDQRINRAHKLIDGVYDNGEIEDDITDAVTDLLHLAEFIGVENGDIMRKAAAHVEAEMAESDTPDAPDTPDTPDASYTIDEHTAKRLLDIQDRHENEKYFEIEELIDVIIGANVVKQ